MKIRSFYKRVQSSFLVTLVYSLIISSPHAQSQQTITLQPPYDSSLFVYQALEKLPSIFNFLIAQEAFTAQLETDLTAEYFMRIQLMLEHHAEVVRLANDLGPELARSSGFTPIMIETSTNRDSFKLNSEEPERLAKTTASPTSPIYINLTYLNQLKPSLLDLVQLLIHELGHKIAVDKDQETVDHLAALIRKSIKPYYSVESFNEIEYHLLSIPSSNPSLFLPDFEDEISPKYFDIVTRNNDGETSLLPIEMESFIQRSSPFSLKPLPEGRLQFPSGALRTLFSYHVSISEAQEEGLTLKKSIEYRLVENTVGLSPEQTRMQRALDKVYQVGFMPLLKPQINFKDVITPLTQRSTSLIPLDLVRPSSKDIIDQVKYIPRPELFTLDPNIFIIDARKENTASGKTLITISTATPISQPIHLHISDGLTSTFIPGKPAPGTANRAFTFLIDSSLLVRPHTTEEIIVDSHYRSLLPQSFDLPHGASLDAFFPLHSDFMEVLTPEGWAQNSFDLMTLKNSRSIKIRFKILDGAHFDIDDIQGAHLSWARKFKITEASKEIGTASLKAQEIIDKGDLKISENTEGRFIVIESNPHSLIFESVTNESGRVTFTPENIFNLNIIRVNLTNGINLTFPIHSETKGFNIPKATAPTCRAIL